MVFLQFLFILISFYHISQLKSANQIALCKRRRLKCIIIVENKERHNHEQQTQYSTTFSDLCLMGSIQYWFYWSLLPHSIGIRSLKHHFFHFCERSKVGRGIFLFAAHTITSIQNLTIISLQIVDKPRLDQLY